MFTYVLGYLARWPIAMYYQLKIYDTHGLITGAARTQKQVDFLDCKTHCLSM